MVVPRHEGGSSEKIMHVQLYKIRCKSSIERGADLTRALNVIMSTAQFWARLRGSRHQAAEAPKEGGGPPHFSGLTVQAERDFGPSNTSLDGLGCGI